MRHNALLGQSTVEVTFDDLVVGADGRVSFHPELTTHISGSQWERLYDGMAFALRLGIVLNVHVTIVWGRLGIGDDEVASKRLKSFCEVLRHRAQARKLSYAFAYAHERTRDQGFHTHLLTAWPHWDRHDFEEWLTGYFADKVSVSGFDPGAVCVRHKRDADVERHWFWFGYLTKGVDTEARFRDADDPHTWHSLRDVMLRHPEPAGRVRCRKRVGVSRNIDKEARRGFGSAGFSSRFLLGANTKQELYTDQYLRDFEAERKSETWDRDFGSIAF